FSKGRWCAWRFETRGDRSSRADSFSGLPTYSERASPAEVGDQLAFARISLMRHFRLFQHNRASGGHQRQHLCYSISSSARASSDGGTINPSVPAVLTLMTSWYFVGACTGRLAGFSPLKMRST